MQTATALILITSATLAANAQLLSSTNAAPGPVDASRPAAYTVKEIGPHHRVWERLEYETNSAGNVLSHVHRYTELASGLYYFDTNANTWRESSEQIEPVPGGAAAVHGQHQSYFPSDIYDGFIELVTPEGTHLKSRPLCLSYFDGTNSVIIGTLSSSVGEIIGSNQVIYADAFTNSATGQSLKADLIYKHHKGSFEQDVLLRQQLPSPESYGMNSQNTRLEVLTEYLDSPQPQITARTIPTADGEMETDDISFGIMRMGQGTAFMLGTNSPSVHVSKRWLQLDGRQILLEEVPVPPIHDALSRLPSQAASPYSPVFDRLASNRRNLPPSRLAKPREQRPLEIAKAAAPNSGFLLDPITLNSGHTDFTFSGDTTYYVTALVALSGTTTIEGGTVIKFPADLSGRLLVNGPIVCRTAPYHPAVFTAKDDNSIGESIGNGNPIGWYGSEGLMLNSTGPGISLSNLRFSYLRAGMNNGLPGNWGLSCTNCQFVGCYVGIFDGNQNSRLDVRNALFAHCTTAIYDSSYYGITTMNVQHATFDQVTYLASRYGGQFMYSYLYLTNCVLASVSQLSAPGQSSIVWNGSYNGFYNSSSTFGSPQISGPTPPNSPFQTVRGGTYYLATNPNGSDASNFRGQGTLWADPALLANLQQKTTYPPLVYDNLSIPADTVFSQPPVRTTEYPALGYHYDRLDHIFTGCTANGSMTFAAGTACGWYRTTSQGHGIQGTDVSVAFNATQVSPAYWVRLNTVQEQDASGGGTSGGLFVSGTTVPAQVNARFTRFSMMAGEDRHIGGDNMNAQFTLKANHCEFWGSMLGGAYSATALNLTNCLLDRCLVEKVGSSWGDVNLRNCTMHGAGLLLLQNSAAWQPSIRDCAFDGTSFTFTPPISGLDYDWSHCDFDYNAFSGADPTFPTSGPPLPQNDLANVNFNWQSAPLGHFYSLSSISPPPPLKDKGSRSASDAGLPDFTTLTDESKDGSAVDIGYHYVALDQNGSAIDSNGDGIPDWWARLFGFDPAFVANDTDQNDLLGKLGDPDADGVNNLGEYLTGSSPVRPNSINIGGIYKTVNQPASAAAKAYDIYYRPGVSSQWRRISSGVAGQKLFTFINPNPNSEGDFIFLDAADGDGDGLSNGYENWFTYVPGANVQSLCPPRNLQLTCPEQADSDADSLKDGWKVGHGLNPMKHDGVSDPNDPNYIVPGDTLNNGIKEANYENKLSSHQPFYATYDPLNIAGSASVRPVVTISQSPADAFNSASFTITRDVGGDANGNPPPDLQQRLAQPLTVYYALGGTLAYGIDYALIPAPVIANGIFSVQIPAAQTSVPVTIVVTAGVSPRGPPSVVVTLTQYPSVQ